MLGHGIFKFPGGGGVSYFTKLLDAFSSYTGLGGKILAVKADETGIEAIYAPSGGGGGSGGGSINIFYGGTYTKNGSVLATGGDGGTGSYDGGKGGDGCITEQQI